MTSYDDDILEVLVPADLIEKRVAEMGREIAATYRDSVPLLIGVLKGCAVFMGNLIPHIAIPVEIDFICVSSFHGRRQRSGAVRITKDLDQAVEGRDLLLVEGIVDTGMTTGYILRNLQVRHPKRILICTLLDKPARRIVDVPIAFRGIEIPDKFVVGYGLDFLQLYRNLPYIGVLKDEVTGLKVPRQNTFFKKNAKGA